MAKYLVGAVYGSSISFSGEKRVSLGMGGDGFAAMCVVELEGGESSGEQVVREVHSDWTMEIRLCEGLGVR